jgi:hypothetical protein
MVNFWYNAFGLKTFFYTNWDPPNTMLTKNFTVNEKQQSYEFLTISHNMFILMSRGSRF